MSSTDILTTDRLDEIGELSHTAEDPAAIAADLVRAVEEGRVEDPEDTGYALVLAAEITEREGDLGGALALITRAIDEHPAIDDGDNGYARAIRGGLLIRLGRDDEGLAELAALRPLLETDPSATHLIDELEESGHAETALDWLTEALEAILDRTRTDSHESEEAQAEAAAMVYGLAQRRHALREEMDLPHDALDHLADRLQAATGQALDSLDDGPATLLFWPQAQFNALLLRWPALVGSYPPSWDEHRAQTERGLVAASELGAAGLGVVAGSVEGLAKFVEQTGGDPTDEDTLDDYADSMLDEGEPTPWPPGRNDACWCGSGSKYKKCCLARSRT